MNANYRNTRATSASQKILALGLASATCVGLVGVLAVRSTQEASAQEAITLDVGTQIALAAATTSDGVTQVQLDQYAAQLATERARLEAYRQQLVTAANQLSTQTRSTVTTVKPQQVPTKPKTTQQNSTASSSSANTVYVAPEPQTPTVQAPAQKQFVPAAPQQPAASSANNSAPAPAPAAKTKASKG
jgi:hypothetical protein